MTRTGQHTIQLVFPLRTASPRKLASFDSREHPSEALGSIRDAIWYIFFYNFQFSDVISSHLDSTEPGELKDATLLSRAKISNFFFLLHHFHNFSGFGIPLLLYF